jgi:hypothetical protein
VAKSPGHRLRGRRDPRRDAGDAVSEILKFDAAHPQLTGWAMVGGWPLFRSSQSPAMMNEIQKRNLKIVAVDALPEQLVYLERGLVPVLWAQPVYDWGTVGVSTIVDKVLLKKSPPRTIRMEPIRVTRDDLKRYAQKLHGWGFTVPRSTSRNSHTTRDTLRGCDSAFAGPLALSLVVSAGFGIAASRSRRSTGARSWTGHSPVLRGFETARRCRSATASSPSRSTRPASRPSLRRTTKGVPLGTLSQWAWHTDPNPNGYSIDRLRLTPFESHGRQVPTPTRRATSARPRSSGCGATRTGLHLGRIGFHLRLKEGARGDRRGREGDRAASRALGRDAADALPAGRRGGHGRDPLPSHPDAIGVRVVSPLVARGQIGIRCASPTAAARRRRRTGLGRRRTETKLVRSTSRNALFEARAGPRPLPGEPAWSVEGRLKRSASTTTC